jgi:hypothetical protein
VGAVDTGDGSTVGRTRCHLPSDGRTARADAAVVPIQSLR